MPFYSLGKNEVRALIDKEKKINDELMQIKHSDKNVLSIREVALLSDLKKVRAKLKLLRSDSDLDDMA
jgi:hypothetical protein